ncbi:MAG: hypothetical protein DRQ78_09735, partial [Epsilonproteobacteria bacterium]
MYINVIINGGPSLTVSTVSVAEMRTIERETSVKYGLLVVLGDQQVERIITEGDTQDTRVIAEGDTQTARVVAVGDPYLADIATEGDSELLQIADAGDAELSDITTSGDQYLADIITSGDQYLTDIATEGASELLQIATEGDSELLQIADAGDAELLEIADEGDIEVARVRAVGDAQELIVTNEGDTQVARVIAEADKAEDYSGWADAGSRNSDAWANTAADTDVIDYTWDEINNVIVETPMVGKRSSFHWEEQAKLFASGMQPKGIWDSVACSLPPVPTPDPGELANGWMYIVGSVTGDTSGCPDLSEGDWIVWFGDLVGDGAVEGSWNVINWSFDWSAITGVPENVYNALSRSGGIMTTPVTVSYDASAPAASDLIARSYIDALAALFMPINASLPFTAVPRTTAAQGTDASELTRKDYVDGLAILRVLQTEYDSEQGVQDSAIALNTAKLTGADRVLQTEYDSEQGVQD